MHDPMVYLNGEMTPLSEARISVLDRGFLFGDGVYEVIPVFRRRPFCAEQHMARLFRSLAAIKLSSPHSKEEWLALVDQVVREQAEEDQMVYLQVTRGAAKRTHAFPDLVVPTVFIMSNPVAPPSQSAREKGVTCVTIEDQRWLHCNIKSISLLGSVLAAQHAVESGALEAIQFRAGYLTEASASNVWIAKDGVLMAPPADHLILEGVRYGWIVDFCKIAGIPFEARQITKSEVLAADEVLLSSATKEVLAVVSIDGATIGSGSPGPIFRRLLQAYEAAKLA